MSGDMQHWGFMPPEHIRIVWVDWFRRHGIDPNDVAVPGWVERRETDYQLCYASYRRNTDGQIIWDGATGEAVREWRVFQMEGPPLPWPDWQSAKKTGAHLDEAS